jgi:MFS family permease
VGATVTDAPPRRSLALLLDPRFGSYMLGRTLMAAGVWIHNIVAVVLVYDLTGSAFLVGLVNAAEFVPQILFATLSGSAADRGNRKRQVILGRLVVVVGSGGLALWLWLVESSDATPWMVVLSAAVVGVGFVTGGPAMHALVPALVRPNEIAPAVTLNIAPMMLARAGGPILGAWVALAASPAVALVLSAACNVGFVLILLLLSVPRAARDEARDTSMRAAVRYVRKDPVILLLLIGVGSIGISTDPAVTLAPALSDVLGYGTRHTGTFVTAFGAGAGLAFLLIPALRRWLGVVRSAGVGMVLIPAGLVVLVVAREPWVAVIGFGLSGLGMTMALTGLSAHLQERVPDGLRGRVMALWSMAFLGSRPFAAAVDGAIADHVSVPAAFGVVAVLGLVVAWICRPGRLSVPPPARPAEPGPVRLDDVIG